MELGAAGLKEQPFKIHGKPLSVVSCASHDKALAALADLTNTPNGIMLLQGPALSGKTTIISRFVDELRDDYPVAVVDGKGLNANQLLEKTLRQFGYVFEHNSPNELLGMLRVFVMQQAASYDTPLLIISNADLLDPSAMNVLPEIAAFNVRGKSALKIVLVSDHSLRSRVDTQRMAIVARRIKYDLHLEPLTRDEAVTYVHTKLQIAGSDAPEKIFPAEVCDELWHASGGWPGILDRLALMSLARAESLPVSSDNIEKPALPNGTWDELDSISPGESLSTHEDPPTIFVSYDGETILEMALERARILVGRSEHNDIAISSKFVSRHHALFVRSGQSTFLMDLNSTNGTFVNSKQISSHLLAHDDVVTIGHHRIKFKHPGARRHVAVDTGDNADTVVMKTMDDMRKILAQENTAILPALTENLPTSGS